MTIVPINTRIILSYFTYIFDTVVDIVWRADISSTIRHLKRPGKQYPADSVISFYTIHIYINTYKSTSDMSDSRRLSQITPSMQRYPQIISSGQYLPDPMPWKEKEQLMNDRVNNAGMGA